MPKLIIQKLIWNTWNLDHIGRHKVSKKEVEEACQSKIKTKETYGERLIAYGVTKSGRKLAVVIFPKGLHEFFVVTARDMNRKERRWYNQ